MSGGPKPLGKMFRNWYHLFLSLHPAQGEESEPYTFSVHPLGGGGSQEASRAVSASVCY